MKYIEMKQNILVPRFLSFASGSNIYEKDLVQFATLRLSIVQSVSHSVVCYDTNPTLVLDKPRMLWDKLL